MIAITNPKKGPDAAELRRLISLVSAQLAEADRKTGPFDMSFHSEWFARRHTAISELTSFLEHNAGAAFRRTGAHEHSVRLAGIRATSTSGFEQALRNWQHAAARKIGETFP